MAASSAEREAGPEAFELALRHTVLARTGDADARRWLAEHYAPLAERLARRMYRGGDLSDDFRQVAHEYLLRALDRFDPTLGYPFEAFATPTIVGALKRHYRDHVWALRVPRQVHEMAGPIAATAEALTHRLGTSPTPQQLADALDITVEELLEMQECIEARRPTSIEVGWPGDPATPVDPIAASDDHLALQQALVDLPERDRALLELSYAQGLSQVEIASRYGVSQMQVSRWLTSAVNRLRDRLAS